MGRALLNQLNDPFLEYWEYDLTSKKAREKYDSVIDHEYQKKIEEKVSEYIRTNLSFTVFKVNSKEERLSLESKLISTVSWCEECRASSHWLGSHSPKDKIVQSGLWLVNELYKSPFNFAGIEHLSKVIKG